MNVVCLGDLMTDVVAHLPGPLTTGSDTPARIGLYGGGSAANTACWLAATGTPVTFAGRVGDDALGRAAVAELAAAGVCRAVTVDPDRPTGTCVVLVSPTGERTMIPDAGANAGPTDLPTALLSPGAHLHVSGYALLNTGARASALAALAAARASDVPVSVDAASAAPLATVGAETFLSSLGTGLLLFANTDEARVLTGCADPIEAALTLAERCGHCVVKRGGDGAIWAEPGNAVPVAAEPVEALDTTGAGDAFAAGFLAARALGLDPVAAIVRGHRLAAQAVRLPGGRPAREPGLSRPPARPA